MTVSKVKSFLNVLDNNDPNLLLVNKKKIDHHFIKLKILDLVYMIFSKINKLITWNQIITILIIALVIYLHQ